MLQETFIRLTCVVIDDSKTSEAERDKMENLLGKKIELEKEETPLVIKPSAIEALTPGEKNANTFLYTKAGIFEIKESIDEVLTLITVNSTNIDN